MPSFVLVHGAAHGAWCWERVVPVLAAADAVDRVIAVDLPGHGAQRDVKPQDRITLGDYVDAVVDAITGADLHDVVLVGHSLGGITVTEVAHAVPDRLRHLVYLATVNPPVGGTVEEAMQEEDSPVRRDVGAKEMFCSDLWRASSSCGRCFKYVEPHRPIASEGPVEGWF